ncbi:MAG: SurA N-terminal domain-containing protein [Ahrensia sp.]|nr:SurA N-terminal domain-containing protein [Ahrensia sp.]
MLKTISIHKSVPSFFYFEVVMLSMLRNASKGWISKILLLLLVLSFAVWGISGQTGGIGASGATVTAGATKVSASEYLLAYNRQLNVIQQRIRQRITPEQARLFGIENQVASQLAAGGAVLDEQARLMKLGLSEENLSDLIASDEAFQGLNGSFDRGQFRSVLRNVGMTEADYIESRKKAAQRQQIAEALSDGVAM